jgi:hypothetical protein
MTTRRGRKSIRSPKLERQICDLLASGNTIKTVVDAVGISERVYFEWCERYPHFLQATTRARGRARIKLVKVLVDASALDWRSAAWLLERGWPNEFGRTAERPLQEPLQTQAPTRVIVNVRRDRESDAAVKLFGERPADRT